MDNLFIKRLHNYMIYANIFKEPPLLHIHRLKKNKYSYLCNPVFRWTAG